MRTRARRNDWKCKCDDCQENFHASQLREMWDGKYVCTINGCYERRHPADFYKITEDDQSVPWSRPESTNTFLPTICPAHGNIAIGGIGVAGCAISGFSNT